MADTAARSRNADTVADPALFRDAGARHDERHRAIRHRRAFKAVERIGDHTRGENLLDRERLGVEHGVLVEVRPFAQCDADRGQLRRRAARGVHVTPHDHRTDGVELDAGRQFPFAGNAVLRQHRDHFVEVCRTPALALQHEDILGVTRRNQPVRRARRIVAGRAARVHHEARLARAMDAQLLDHAGEYQIGLICTAVQARDEQDRIDITRRHLRILERQDRNCGQRLDKAAIRIFARWNFADADKYRVVFLTSINM